MIQDVPPGVFFFEWATTRDGGLLRLFSSFLLSCCFSRATARAMRRERERERDGELRAVRDRHEFEKKAATLPAFSQKKGGRGRRSEEKEKYWLTRLLTKTIASKTDEDDPFRSLVFPSSPFQGQHTKLHGCSLRPGGTALAVREKRKRGRRERTSSSKSILFLTSSSTN